VARIPKAPAAAEGKPREKTREKPAPASIEAEQKPEAESDKIRREPDRQPLVIAPGRVDRIESQAQSRDEELKADNARRARRERTRFGFEIIAVIAVAFAAYFLWGQLKLIRGQLAGLNEGLRPSVGLSGFAIDPAQIAPDQPFTVTYTIKNSGMTPGYHVHGWFRVDIADAERDDAPQFPSCGDGGTECSDQFLPPAAAYAMKQTVSPDDMAKIDMLVNDRNQRLYLLGRVDYEDWAHNPHWTNICLYYDPALKSVTACAKWNDTDQPSPSGR
jgi:hypothetical protein